MTFDSQLCYSTYQKVQMLVPLTIVLALFSFPLLFPEETLYWCRKLRDIIDADLRRRLGDEEFERWLQELDGF